MNWRILYKRVSHHDLEGGRVGRVAGRGDGVAGKGRGGGITTGQFRTSCKEGCLGW